MYREGQRVFRRVQRDGEEGTVGLKEKVTNAPTNKNLHRSILTLSQKMQSSMKLLVLSASAIAVIFSFFFFY
jgi:hypothetical protein